MAKRHSVFFSYPFFISLHSRLLSVKLAGGREGCGFLKNKKTPVFLSCSLLLCGCGAVRYALSPQVGMQV
jgi:hypothetical protein